MSELGEYYQDKKEVQERIKADADKLYPLFLQADTKAGYIAGATDENARFQPIIDVLDQFISYHETGLLPAKHVYEKAIAVRKQWKEGKDKQIELSCMVCGTTFMGPEPKMCCSGRDCGCMGLPIEPIVCSEECYNKGIPPQKGNSGIAVESD